MLSQFAMANFILMNKISLHSNKISKGNLTYFFDVKLSVTGQLYLAITESTFKYGKRERVRFVIYKENLSDFLEGFEISVSKMRRLQNAKMIAAPKDELK